MMKPEHSYEKRINVGSAAGNGLSRGTMIKQMKVTFCCVGKYSASQYRCLTSTEELGIFAKSIYNPVFSWILNLFLVVVFS